MWWSRLQFCDVMPVSLYFTHDLDCTISCLLEMEGESLFRFSIKSILKNWTALQLAIKCGMGGPYSNEKEIWFGQVIEEYFLKNADLSPDEVGVYLEYILNYEFDTFAEDGSILEISRKLCQFFKWCQSGDEQKVLDSCPPVAVNSVERSRTLCSENPAEPPLQQMQNLNISAESASAESTVMSDDDGWIEVKSHRKVQNRK